VTCLCWFAQIAARCELGGIDPTFAGGVGPVQQILSDLQAEMYPHGLDFNAANLAQLREQYATMLVSLCDVVSLQAC
jgi:hypothetical protein